MAALDRFTTARLRAERLRPGDFGEVRRMHLDAVAMEHLGGVRDEAGTTAYFERNLKHWRDHGFGLWIVYERNGVEPIGRAMLRWLRVDDTDEVRSGMRSTSRTGSADLPARSRKPAWHLRGGNCSPLQSWR